MKLFILKEEQEVFDGYTLIATFEPYEDGILVTPTTACTIGRYFAALNALNEKGYTKVYEKPFK